MIKLNFRLPFRPTLFLIPVLILAACGPAASADNFVISRQASPTPSVFPAAVQPTQPVSTQVPLQVRLAVIKPRAQITRGGTVQTEVQQAQSTDIQIDDGIEMVKPDGQSQPSYGILHLPDFVNVELFGKTKMFLEDVRKGAEGFADLTLDLDKGHMFVHLNDQRSIRVTVRTPYATIRTLTSGAEFDVCRNEELTCILVKSGIVEIVAQDRREIVRAGSAGVVLKDQPLSPLICAPLPKFTAWEEHYRLFVNTPALQEEIAELPQKPCPVTADGFPLNARILYQDEFTNASRGWDQGTIDNFTVRYVRYSGARYYQVQVQGPEDQYLAFVPNERDYEDVNIDIKTRAEAASGGDFRYGVVFRRSGDQYYAFVVSPPTEAWYFLKSSSDGMELLKYGIEKRMRGLDGQDTLRVETYGSTFLVFINGRFIDWISDSDYANGEAGLFADTIDNPDALINFNSIIIWDIPAPVFNPNQGENCFNASDDDGDGWIDQADPNCQRQELAVTSLAPSPTESPLPTNTPRTGGTPTARPPATQPPAPTATSRPPATQPPIPTLRPPTVIGPLPTLSLPTVVVPLPTLPLPLPTISLPLPTIVLPLPTLPLPLPTIILPLPIVPPVQTPIP
jgi:hypothetical protein